MGQSILEQEDFIGMHHKLRQESLIHMFLCDETGVMDIPTPSCGSGFRNRNSSQMFADSPTDGCILHLKPQPATYTTLHPVSVMS